jgi:hypothetical protein
VRSGELFVTSEKSEDVWKRRPGLVGRRERIAMMSSVLKQRDFARCQGDDGTLAVRL